MDSITCKCGASIPDENIYSRNGCNEEGEEYGVVDGECPVCKIYWEASQWGEWDDREQAKAYLADYIKGG